MLAADEEQLEVVKILLEAGADPRAADSDGRTALMRVVESDRVDIARELVEARADPLQADDEGLTAFQEARNRANPKLIHLFQGIH
jgi:ankyrin repeat protein